MKWSVALQAEGDRVLKLAEVVELADAVAPMGGIASGVGTMTFGARLLIEAESADEAVKLAIRAFESAAAQADLPLWPISHTEVIGENEESFDDA